MSAVNTQTYNALLTHTAEIANKQLDAWGFDDTSLLREHLINNTQQAVLLTAEVDGIKGLRSLFFEHGNVDTGFLTPAVTKRLTQAYEKYYPQAEEIAAHMGMSLPELAQREADIHSALTRIAVREAIQLLDQINHRDTGIRF